MIKDIVDGTKEVVLELRDGMKESYEDISVRANKIFTAIEVKLMGSYEELEAYEKAKEAEKTQEAEKAQEVKETEK